MTTGVLTLALVGLPAVAASVAPTTAAEPSSCIRIIGAVFDGPGDDSTMPGLNGEWVRIKSFCTVDRGLSRWTLADAGGTNVFTFAQDTRLGVGRTLRVVSGRGTDTATVKYWGRNTGDVWNDAAAETAYLRNAHGALRSSWSYPGEPTLVGAGDIAKCNATGDEQTRVLLAGIPGTIFTAGDNVYPSGTPSQFTNCYAPSWGRYRARTRPSPGNHDYGTSGASGYFDYFGSAAGEPGKGYYSYDLGRWHVIALNSNCSVVPCARGSLQELWLRADLAASTARCTIAYWHHARFSSGPHGDYAPVGPFWDALYDAGADVIVVGHDHDYERFARQAPDGSADPERGIRQFVAGTGGGGLYAFATLRPNSEVRSNGAYGVLKLTLREDGYDWEFLPVEGRTFNDRGSEACH